MDRGRGEGQRGLESRCTLCAGSGNEIEKPSRQRTPEARTGQGARPHQPERRALTQPGKLRRFASHEQVKLGLGQRLLWACLNEVLEVSKKSLCM